MGFFLILDHSIFFQFGCGLLKKEHVPTFWRHCSCTIHSANQTRSQCATPIFHLDIPRHMRLFSSFLCFRALSPKSGFLFALCRFFCTFLKARSSFPFFFSASTFNYLAVRFSLRFFSYFSPRWAHFQIFFSVLLSFLRPLGVWKVRRKGKEERVCSCMICFQFSIRQFFVPCPKWSHCIRTGNAALQRTSPIRRNFKYDRIWSVSSSGSPCCTLRSHRLRFDYRSRPYYRCYAATRPSRPTISASFQALLQIEHLSCQLPLLWLANCSDALLSHEIVTARVKFSFFDQIYHTSHLLV